MRPRLDLEELTKLICKHYHVDSLLLHSQEKTHIYAKLRAKIACLAKDLKICTITAVATYFNRDATVLMRAIKRLSSCPEEMQELEKDFERVKVSTSQA